jgi:hypothetical protein
MMRNAVVNLLTRAKRQQTSFEVEDELQFHIEMLERKYALQGLSAADAKAAAVRRFGNFERVKKQCVNISRRQSLPHRLLKTSAILMALTGLAIHFLSSDYNIARIGQVLIMIAVLGRLLLYVRSLNSWTFLSGPKETSLSINPADGART